MMGELSGHRGDRLVDERLHSADGRRVISTERSWRLRLRRLELDARRSDVRTAR